MFATSYRPSKFSEVIGQELAKSTLKTIALADGIKVRSIVIQGPWGTGKSTLSRIFAKAFNCKEFKKQGDVCCECEACKDVVSPSSMTYREYDATKIGNVEGIKNLLESLQISNYEGRRVITIDECHAVSLQAQTALLKALEEGVPNTVFVFCSTEKLLETIKSRSVCLELSLLKEEEIIAQLEKIASKESISVTPKVLEDIAIKSRGHMRDAVSLLEHFSMVGEQAVKTPLQDIRAFFLSCFKKNPDYNLLMQIMQYPLVEIQQSLRLFIKMCFVAVDGFEGKLRKMGLSVKLFQFFYTVEAQNAVKDEVGMEILLRAFAEQYTS